MVKELQRKFIKTTMLVVTILLAVFLVLVNILNYSMTKSDSRERLDQIAAENARSMPGDNPGARTMTDPEHEKVLPSGRRQNLGSYFVARLNASGAVTFYDLTHDASMTFEGMTALINQADVAFAPQATGETETEPVPSSGESVPPDRDPGNPAPAGSGDSLAPGADQPGGAGNAPQPGSDTVTEKPGEDALPGAEGRTGEDTPPDEAGRPGEDGKPGEDVPHDPAGGEGEKTLELQEKRGRADGYLYYAVRQADGSVSYAFLDVSQETQAMLRIILITVVLGAALWLLILLIVIFLSKKAIAPIAENIEKQRLFITNAGHEFKTPLAVIVSNVDVQELHGGKTKWLDNIRTQALRLSDLTKQMLTLAKMEESGTAAFTAVTFDASQVLENTIRIFKESASLRGIRIQTAVEQGVQMHFPKEQYQQMLELLLDNAVKYGKEHGFLSVALRAERKMVHLSFQNDCEKLPEVTPDQLFDRFYRPDSSRNRNTGGSGIGLAVVRAIAQQQGGSAKAQYLPNQVIAFDIELPARV